MGELRDDVALAVADLLDSEASHRPEVAEVQRIRAATRRVLEGSLPADEEDKFLAWLARRASVAALPMWALEAILAELNDPAPQPALLSPIAIGRLRELARYGHSACPTCLREIPAEAVLLAQEQARQDHAAQLSALAQAGEL